MRHLTFIFLLGSFSLLGQTDSIILYTTNGGIFGDSILIPAELVRRGATVPKIFHLKYQKIVDQTFAMGFDALYQPESDIPAANKTKGITRALTYMVPISVQNTNTKQTIAERALNTIYGTSQNVDASEILMVGNYLSEILKPGIYNPGTTPTIPLYDTIDSAPSQQIVYGGTWAHVVVSGHHKNTISFSNTSNSYIEFNVTGKQINLFFERKSTHGMTEIILNGVAQVPLIDLYTATRPELKKQLLYSAMLRPGPNTIRIRVTGAKNPASSSQYVVFDFATVMK